MRIAVLEAAALTAVGSLVGVLAAVAIIAVSSNVVQSIYGIDLFSITAPGPAVIASAVGIALVGGCGVAIFANLFRAKDWAGVNLVADSGAKSSRLSNWVIGCEVFACTFLMSIVAADCIATLKVAGQPSGFSTRGAVTTTLESGGRPEREDGPNCGAVEVDPGVQAVATMNMPPLNGATASTSVGARNQDGLMRQQTVWPAVVSVRYFSAIGTRIIRGRDFERTDLAGDPVCVVSTRAASILFPGTEPLEKTLYRGTGGKGDNAPAVYCRVVGEAEDAHFQSMSGPADAVVYLLTGKAMPTLVVRAASNSLAIQAIRSALQAIDPAAPSAGIFTVESIVEKDLRMWKIFALAGGLCACLAAIVLSVGFFGVISLQVSQRRREIGIQIALGAGWKNVCLSLVGKLRLPVALGLALGSVLTLCVGHIGTSLRHKTAGRCGRLLRQRYSPVTPAAGGVLDAVEARPDSASGGMSALRVSRPRPGGLGLDRHSVQSKRPRLSPRLRSSGAWFPSKRLAAKPGLRLPP